MELRLTQLVRVAHAGLKAVVFSAICEGLVRVAGKELTGDAGGVTSCKTLGLEGCTPSPGFL